MPGLSGCSSRSDLKAGNSVGTSLHSCTGVGYQTEEPRCYPASAPDLYPDESRAIAVYVGKQIAQVERVHVVGHKQPCRVGELRVDVGVVRELAVPGLGRRVDMSPVPERPGGADREYRTSSSLNGNNESMVKRTNRLPTFVTPKPLPTPFSSRAVAFGSDDQPVPV